MLFKAMFGRVEDGWKGVLTCLGEEWRIGRDYLDEKCSWSHKIDLCSSFTLN
jgi:hypothetical protein